MLALSTLTVILFLQNFVTRRPRGGYEVNHYDPAEFANLSLSAAPQLQSVSLPSPDFLCAT